MYIYYGSKHSMENKRFNSAVTAYDWLNGKQKILHRKKKDERTRIKECSEMCFISTEQRDRVMQKKKKNRFYQWPSAERFRADEECLNASNVP